MSVAQLKLDFSKVAVRIPDGKKMQRIGIACSEEFKEVFTQICKLRKSSESEIGFEYLLKGMKEDLLDIFMPEPHLDKSLREIIKRFA